MKHQCTPNDSLIISHAKTKDDISFGIEKNVIGIHTSR